MHSPIADSHAFGLPAIGTDLGAVALLTDWTLGQTAPGDELPPKPEPPPAPGPRHYDRDLEAMQTYRPGYRFWRHVFTIPNGRMAFASAADGSLLASFPLGRNWLREADWADSSLADLLAGEPIRGGLAERRDGTAQRLEQAAGPVVYHETRGTFVADGTAQYGAFLDEWGAIFERFGVPADVGLAQGLTESGLKGRIRSEAGAIGFCQWLPQNWERLQQLAPNVIEVYNQTTQVPYCAAHLAVLATKYGSLIPALSEHHAGPVNVGRAMINGDFAGGGDVRERYFLGAELTLLVRRSRPPGYREVVGSYGPRSFRYAEMVFGNTLTVEDLRGAIPQQRIFAMRPSRPVSLDEVARETGLAIDEIRRFNPALVNRVPARANLYLPFHVDHFGADTAFWHEAATPEYTAVLDEFLRLDERFALEDWHDGSVFATLREFEDRFVATGTEEGAVMAVVIAFVRGELSDGRQRDILAEVRRSERAHRLLEEGIRQRDALLRAVEEINAGAAAGSVSGAAAGAASGAAAGSETGAAAVAVNGNAGADGSLAWARRNVLLTGGP